MRDDEYLEAIVARLSCQLQTATEALGRISYAEDRAAAQ